MKRYPWTVSYGNKHADKAIEATKTLLEKQNVSVPPPSNMDAESAKSLLIFLLKASLQHFVYGFRRGSDQSQKHNHKRILLNITSVRRMSFQSQI